MRKSRAAAGAHLAVHLQMPPANLPFQAAMTGRPPAVCHQEVAGLPAC